MGIDLADDLQGVGLGSLLIAHLATAAAEQGIDWLHADVLPENHAMLQVFRETGFPVTVYAKPGSVSVDIIDDGELRVSRSTRPASARPPPTLSVPSCSRPRSR